MFSVALFQHENPNASREEKLDFPVEYTVLRNGVLENRKHRLANLTANILCERHNSATSELDVQAGLLGAALRDLRDKYIERGKSRLLFRKRVHRIDGPLIERWFMKTAINLLIQMPDGLPIGDGDEINAPAPELVEMVFGRRPVRHPFGMWYAKQQGDDQVFVTSIRTHAWQTDGETACSAGMIIDLAGFAYPINLVDLEPPWDYLRRVLRWREVTPARTINAMGHERAAVTIRFDWSAVAPELRGNATAF